MATRLIHARYRRRWVDEVNERAYVCTKRLLDLMVCLVAVPLLLPLMLLIALIIYIDSPGPVIYTKKRPGRDGRPFTLYKFRTMVPNAEELKAQYMHLNELPWPDFKITNDPRVTRVGRILRRTSLDEVPQFISVVKGDMSLVGPRPSDCGTQDYRVWHTERLEVPPGLTGLWQIRARAKVDFDVRCRLDIYYIRQRSLWLDLKILWWTVPAVIKGDGAY